MGCSPSQPRAAQAKPTQLSVMPSNDQSGTNTPTVPVNAADNRARYDPLQSTSNPTRDVHTQSPTTDSSSASPEAPKQVASVLSTTEVSASGSRPKHTPLARGVRRRNSQRPLRSSAARTRTTDDDTEPDVAIEVQENGQLTISGNGKKAENVPSQKTPLSTMVTSLPPIDRSEATGKSPNHFCSECPHCRRQSEKRKAIIHEQLAWITEKPEGTRSQIVMDDYDEDAVQDRFVSEYGSLPGRYSYLPNIAIQEKEPKDQNQKQYYTSPLVARIGRPIAPTRTPYLY